jgi:4-hydroxythreonine-4-phosphate dehydrogenase
MTAEKKLEVVITMGDPAGIGPEIILKSLTDPGLGSIASWVIVGDTGVLDRQGETCGIRMADIPARFVDVKQLPSANGIRFGELNAACGRAAVEYVRVGTEMCLRREAAALVTAPLNKEAVTLSGLPFTGHTEYIAELCGKTEPCMLLVGRKFSVAHVSTHVPLRKACELDVDRIVRTLELGNTAMRWLGLREPHIAVCGLNPHAGEHGLFGWEDEQFIVPAINEGRCRGIPCEGPCSPDTAFLRASQGEFDLVVAMYHDQGHIPMKLLDFDDAVNVSLGIPILRTSVDHGTAFDIAGQNKARASNMKAALRLAVTMASHRPDAMVRPGKRSDTSL